MIQVHEIEVNEAAARRALGTARTLTSAPMYYRKPEIWPNGRENPDAGWIHWVDTNGTRRDGAEELGFQILSKYGVVRGTPRSDELYKAHGEYAVILSHPDGPAEFCVDQILQSRWFDPRRVGHPNPMLHVRFPKLIEWIKDGNEIVLYDCTVCNRRQFLKAVHLARHLGQMHDWRQEDIFRYGDELGIDFRKLLVSEGRGVIKFDYPSDLPPVRGDDDVTVPVTVKRVSARLTETITREAASAPAQE